MRSAELSSLDALAEVVEIDRLKKLGVLLDSSVLSDVSQTEIKDLTTRMVYDLEKENLKGPQGHLVAQSPLCCQRICVA